METRALTKSFHWDQHEAHIQQDTQEFCRVLFDALEESFKKVGSESRINDIYEGQMADFIVCEECGFESLREQAFLDLSLPVRNPYTEVRNSSLEMALENYMKPEKLEGDNKYECSGCEKKVVAQKGLKFTRMPTVLFVSLSRFMLNFMTMQRIKINDLLSFPFVFNMNDYMGGYEGIKNKIAEKEIAEKEAKLKEELARRKAEEDKQEEARKERQRIREE